jgi:hypothetical protein
MGRVWLKIPTVTSGLFNMSWIVSAKVMTDDL